MCEHALIVCLDDEIGLVPPVVGAAVMNACLGVPAHRRTGSYRVLAEAAFAVLISTKKHYYVALRINSLRIAVSSHGVRPRRMKNY
jgi:hypothetical protein